MYAHQVIYRVRSQADQVIYLPSQIICRSSDLEREWYADQVIWRVDLYADEVIYRVESYADQIIWRVELHADQIIWRVELYVD